MLKLCLIEAESNFFGESLSPEFSIISVTKSMKVHVRKLLIFCFSTAEATLDKYIIGTQDIMVSCIPVSGVHD